MNKRRKFLKAGLLGGLMIPSGGGMGLSNSFSTSLEKLNLIQDVNETEDYWALVRCQFALRTESTYFNNATMGPSPTYVLQQMQNHMMHYSVHAAEVDYKNGSGPELLSGYFPYVDIRKKIGQIIGSEYQNIALTQNATFGMNFVANGLDLKKGDELLNTNQEHGGGFGAWQMAAKRHGCVYKQAKMPVPANDPQEIIDAIFTEVTKKTRVIAIPHIVSVYGTVMPVKEICDEARKRGIFTILDGAQCVGQIDVDVTEIGCDAYYSSLHKWLLAPAGSGILYIHPDHINDIWSTLASYNWDNQEDHGFRLMQYGTGNPALMVGLNASLDFFNKIGKDRWLNRVKYLGDHLRKGLQEMAHVTIESSTHPALCAGITTYKVNGLTGPQLQQELWKREKLQPRSVGNELLRHSTHIYNSTEEIDLALKVIANLA